MSPHPSDQLLERSHVSTTALQCSDDVEIKRWLTEWLCHLSWTAKKSELFFADDETIACFRSTKTIRIPKKVLFLTLTKERNGYIVRQVAKNKEPSHKGWELAPKESTYNLNLIAAIRGHHSSIRLSSLFHMFPVDRYSSLDRRIGCPSSYNSRTRSRGLRQYGFVLFPNSFRFRYLSWHSNWGGEAWRKSGDCPLHSGFQDMVIVVFFRKRFPR